MGASPPSTASRPHPRGFTLIELLVVISVIILLLAISVPALSGYFKSRSLDAAGKVFQSVFLEARQKAVAKKQDYLVLIFRQQDEGALKWGLRLFQPGEGYVGNPNFLAGHLQLDVNEAGDALTYSNIKIFPEGAPTVGSEEYERLMQNDPDEAGLIRFKGSSGEVDTELFDDQHTTWNGQSLFDPNLDPDRIPGDIPTDIKVRSPNSNKMLLIDLETSGQAKSRLVREE